MKAKIVLSLIITGLLLTGITACGPKVDQKVRDRISNIRLNIDSAANKITTVNYDSIHKKFQLFKQTSERIDKNYDAIKSEKSFPVLALYKDCKKPLREVATSYKLYQKDLDSSRIQVDRLEHDIENDLLKPTEIEQFLLVEEQNALFLKGRIFKGIDNAIRYEKRFDTVHPQVLKFFESLKNEVK